jgi:RimJ/RimL family protein N-acetyltransferase
LHNAIASEESTIAMRPLAGKDLSRLWEILREFPERNFDDSGPQTLADFEEMIADRLRREIMVVFEVVFDDRPGELVGATAFEPLSGRSGMLRGVCFARQVHGSGIPLTAMRGAVASLFADGIEKISAKMFADNARAWRFFQKLGAVEEGLLRAETTRSGELVDVRAIALFRET